MVSAGGGGVSSLWYTDFPDVAGYLLDFTKNS